MPRLSPEEEAALMPYVARPADWPAAMAQLPHLSLSAARQRLTRLRRDAGTLWKIDRSAQVRSQPRAGAKFA